MIPLIICLVIFVLLTVIFIFTEKGFWNIVGGSFTLLFLLAVVYGLTVFIGRLELANKPKFTKYEYKELPIQSLINKGGFSVNGSFVLGTGVVSGKSNDYYVSYAMFERGLLRVKVDASNAYIRETDDESPKIINFWIREVWTGYKTKWFWNSKPSVGEWRENKYGDKVVVVPENTVYKDLFKIED